MAGKTTGTPKSPDKTEIRSRTPCCLLRFNDLLLTNPRLTRFYVVSNDARRSLFSRQVFRPTFRRSGLCEIASFLEYANVWDWHSRLLKETPASVDALPTS